VRRCRLGRSPRGDISEVVVDHRSRTGGEGGVDDIDEPSPLPSQRSMVGGGEAGSGSGSDASYGDDGLDAVGQQCGACECVATATRVTHHGEPLDAQGIGDGATSGAADATVRPGMGVDPPYPGLSCPTQRMPSRSDSGKTAGAARRCWACRGARRR
jgi:hypothetical protein